MAVNLLGKSIAITGASSGIGAATAIACARAGMDVAVCARRADKLEEVAQAIRAAGRRAVVMAVDVRDPQACRRFVEESVRAFGGLYAVYANAGYGAEAPAADMPEADVREMFEVNFFGSLNVIRPAIEHMRSRAATSGGPRGHVLWCSSCIAKMALPYYSVYSATKAAQNHLGRGMRLELAPEGIEVSTVHPIGTKTEFFGIVKSRSGGELIAHSPGWFMQTADTVADHTVACLRRPRPEVWTGPKGWLVRLGVSVNTLLPRLADLTLRPLATKRQK